MLVTESCDASHLPAKEGFASEYPGLMHACGHDGHAAMGLALARWVMEHKDELCGTIKILFQPAEEGVRGAAAMAAAGVVDDVDNLIGAHLGTFCRQGEVGLCREGFLASSKLDVHFHGIPSHAGADPQKGRSALMAACAAAMMIQGIPRNGEGDTRVAVGTLHAGEGRNVTPVHADMELEVRGETAEVNDYMRDSVFRIVDGVAQAANEREASEKLRDFWGRLVATSGNRVVESVAGALFVPPELPAGTDAALVAERLAKIVNALRKRDDGKLKKAVLRFFRDTAEEKSAEEQAAEE